MSDSNVYTAERIMNKRTHNGVTQYLIKWKGYSQRDSTWEPVENILDRSLLTAFEKKEPKKTRRGATNQSRTRHANKDSDDRENSINNQSATTSKAEAVTTTPSSPRLEQSTTSRSATPTIPKSPVVNLRSPTTTPPSPIISKPSPTTSGSPSKIITSPAPTNASALRPTPPPNNSKVVPYSPSSTNASTVSTSATSPSKMSEVQVEPLIHSTVGAALPRPSINGSPARITSTPLPINDTNSTINNNNSSKNRRLSSRFAILNTVITDVTVNDQTITISESKTNQGFFREVSRSSVAVDTTHPGESMEID